MAAALIDPSELDARDLRSGGSWSGPQRLKNTLVRALVIVGLTIADRLPANVLRGLLTLLGEAAHRALPGARRRVEVNATSISDEPLELGRACFRSAGASLAECLLLRRARHRALDVVHVAEPDRRALEEALAPGRGAIVVSAHLGPFELVPAAVAALGLRPAVVVRESYDPALDAVVDAHRLARGVRVIHRGKPGASARIVRALREGRPLGILPDLPGRVPSLAVELLGRERPFAVGPARLALRARVPLLAACLGPVEPGDPANARYRLLVRPVEACPDEALLTHRVAATLEGFVRRLPGEWLGMHGGAAAGLIARKSSAKLG